jgi:acetolactate synthase-1/2/3 large subunit
MSDLRFFTKELHRLGVHHMFGVPGEGPSLEVIDELEHRGGKFYSVCHEAAAALMAGGVGRVTGVPGACLSIKGPGFANLAAGVASNWLDRNPSLSISESYGPGSSSSRMHKRLPHAAMIRPVVKAYADNPHPELLPRLWDICLSEEPGPVHIDISGSLTGRDYDNLTAEPDLAPLPPDIAARVRLARRPVLVVGSLAARRRWRDRLTAQSIPVFTTAAGKGIIDESRHWSAGVFTNAGGRYAPETSVLQKADLVVGLGLRTTEILDAKPFPAPLILLDEVPGRGTGLGAVAEAVMKEEGFLEVLELLSGKRWGDHELSSARAALDEQLRLHRWLPAGAFRVAQEVLPASTRFVLDTGNFCTIGEHTLLADRPNHIIGSFCARSMGAAIPFGIGAALAHGDTPTVIAVGDGGVRMYPEAMTLAVSEKLPVLILLMRDGSYASIRQAAETKRLSMRSLHMNSSCWPAVFEKLGCPAERVESFAALEKSLRDWKRDRAPFFLECNFDPEEYLHMTEGIR